MQRLAPSTVEMFVFTYKKGLLSAIAHDLKIRVSQFEIEIDEEARTIMIRIDTTSLHVENAMKNGIDLPEALSEKDKRDIDEYIVKDVLHTTEYPEIVFVSSLITKNSDGYQITGTLKLHGMEREISCFVRNENDRQIAKMRIYQPDFGIKPFSAMFGAMKIQADVDVLISVPAMFK